jgi:membrane associated rhomboid family serine protease
MVVLWIFGNNIEDKLGPWKFLTFYFICGLGSALVHLLFNWSSVIPIIGASGAIAGVMGAYLILFPKAKIKTLVFVLFFITFIDIPAAVFLILWLVLQFLNIGSSSNIAWFAHIGGFLIGAFMISRVAKKPVRIIDDLP